MGVNTVNNIEFQKGLTEIKDPSKALEKLESREKVVLKEAQEFGESEIQATEFVWRNQKQVCEEINGLYPDLEELHLLTA